MPCRICDGYLDIHKSCWNMIWYRYKWYTVNKMTKRSLPKVSTPDTLREKRLRWPVKRMMYWVYWVYCTSAKNSKNSGTVTHWLLNSMLLPPYQSFHSRKFVSLLPLTSYFGQATHLYMLFQLHHLRLPPPLSEAKRVPWLFQGAGTRKTWPNLTSVMKLPAQAVSKANLAGIPLHCIDGSSPWRIHSPKTSSWFYRCV